ncbi:bck1-like resistance to osmotic shock [Yamadazyma tenuis]|uniref:BRO domain-containing protein 1 n=1 Tax=Candida tenuis (strain ATCC 10573 / BCRC 21748 / CBS 615 / JCM 9827 / NBRC 10315 / NRRL Y-1498 / VKM Y-70) TaxID=590646 RepID=G3AYT8_CANTC|nr:uncharacterized protein CANTEDRAFT_118848 [Yamadazyma tenuis ATCC 10573]EGV65926.1 hypothetical protein CANTEDRAFT_118848 [Yamadazyma tenuis ATCC 10573]WEJ95742.1 bck1-like resistance to osmotic shock [Yamadazyma tenuis]
MKTYILSVPTKKYDEVNWVQPLDKYLQAIYGDSHEYQSDLTGFDKLRQDLKGVNADTTGLKLYFKYYSQLELLDLRIAFNQISSKKLNFTWHDAFQKSVNHKQHSLPFEKANILFNIASVLSKIGCKKYEEAHISGDLGSSDTFKEALQYFQQAAGVFEFISENFLHAPSDDLSQSTLLFLRRLMLAQSQEIFVLKVITSDLDQTKNSLIAKLCASASEHFLECHKMIDSSIGARESQSTSDFEIVGDDEDGDLERIVDPVYDPDSEKSSNKITVKLDILWTSLISFKSVYYKSLSYYFNGLQLESGNRFGNAIAYFTKSQDSLNQLSTITLKQLSNAGVNGVFEVLDNYKYQKDALSIKLAELNKENDLIYHEIIPSLVTLPEIKALDSTKVIPINQIAQLNEISDNNYVNFLKNVVPIDTHELLSYYSEEKSQFLRNEIDMVDVSNEELSSVLEYLKMPKAIVNLKQIIGDDQTESQTKGPTAIEPGIIEKANEIHRHHSADIANKAKIVETRKKIYALITEIESQTNNFSGSKYKDDTVNIKKSLYDATTPDDKLFALISVENSHLYNILGKGVNSQEFKGLFEVKGQEPSTFDKEISLLDIVDVPSKSTNEVQQQIKKIEDILYDLNVIKSNKLKLVETLKKEIHNDDISDIIVLNSKSKSINEIKSVIFPEELKKFDPYAQELDKLIENQKTFINNLKEEWASLSTNEKVKEIQSSKTFKETLMKDQMQRVNEFYNNWKTYSLGLNRGVEFYSKLLSFVQSMKRRITTEQEESLSDRFGGMNLQNTGQAQAPQQYNQSQIRPQASQYAQQPQYSGQHKNYQPPAPGRYSLPSGPNSLAASPHSQLSDGQYFPQPLLKRTSTSSSYDRPPPSLPPKQPQYSQPPQQQYTQPSQQQYSQPPQQYSNPNQGYPYQPQAPPQPPQQGSSSSLIYDQPSTYNPNMYNFFSKE